MSVAIKKCEFFIRKTDFIGFIIKLGKISMDPKKVKAIVSWQELENVIQLKSFLGFYNYYRGFIAQWLKSIKPFTRLIKKEKLNRRQVKWAEMLTEYYFEIYHTKGTENARADTLSRKVELQNSEKPLGALLQKD